MEKQLNTKSSTIDSYLSVASVRSCTKYWEIFSAKAKQEDDAAHKYKLELLRDVTSFCFNFDEFSGNFRPLFNFYHVGTSPIMEDLDDNKIEQLVELMNETDDFELKARIADVLQFRAKKNRLKYAEIAVDSYLSCVTENDYMRHEYLDRVKRMSQLAIKFVKGAKHITDRVVEFFDKVITDEVGQKNYYSAIEMLHIFAQYDLIEPTKNGQYAILCHELVVKLEEGEMWRAAEIGYEVAIEYFSTETQKKLLLADFAGLCVKLSKIEASIQKLNYLRKAITLYRKAGSITNKDVIESLELQLPELTRLVWAGNMKQYQVKSDITEVIKSVESSLLNTSLKDKVIQLSLISNFWDRDEAIAFIQKCLQGGFLKTGISEIYDANFNLQHTTKNDNTDNFTQEFHILKGSCYSMRVALIEFIRITIMNEHNPTLFDFKYLYRESPWAPIHNELQISRGIYAGFCGDWMTCGLFLLPIIEVMLGSYLSSKGQSTIKCNIDNTQENRSLSELLSDKETINILGKKITFELDFLLIDRVGYKLRHSSSHGGLSDREFFNDGIKIVWWVIIKLLLELK